MGIRKIALGLVVVAALGAAPAMAAAPVRPSAASISAPMVGSYMAGVRLGAQQSKRSSNITGGAAVIGVLAAAAVVGGVVAATSGGHSQTSP